MNYIIFDLEWNNAYNYKTKKGMNEIIEIGAVKLDRYFNVIDTFKQLISPKLSKKLSSRFKNLTHITVEEIKDNGIPFEQAINDFARWADKENSIYMSWSNSDLYVLIDNFKYFFGKTSIDFIKKYVDIQKFCQRNIKSENSNQISLSNCAEIMSISVDNENLHRALEDCYLAAKCFEKSYNESDLKNYIVNCDKEFFERLVYKPFNITQRKYGEFNVENIKFNCPICNSQLLNVTEYEYKYNAFRNLSECKECNKKFWVLFRAKKTYDGIEIHEKITPVSKKRINKINKTVNK